MAPDDLSRLPDEDLYALEGERTLDHASLARIDAELRRRRESRRASLADMVTPIPAAVAPPTLGDLERVAAGLGSTLDSRIAYLDQRVSRLRRWIVLSPLLWMLVGAGVLVAVAELAPGVLRTLLLAR